MTDAESKQPTNTQDYLKMALAVVVIVLGFAGWFVQWQVSVQSNFSMQAAQIQALDEKLASERAANVEGRREILSELRTIRSEIRAVFLQGVQSELARERRENSEAKK